jgi:hypothetical protein
MSACMAHDDAAARRPCQCEPRRGSKSSARVLQGQGGHPACEKEGGARERADDETGHVATAVSPPEMGKNCSIRLYLGVYDGESGRNNKSKGRRCGGRGESVGVVRWRGTARAEQRRAVASGSAPAKLYQKRKRREWGRRRCSGRLEGGARPWVPSERHPAAGAGVRTPQGGRALRVVGRGRVQAGARCGGVDARLGQL